jgi:two-component system OmpR family response regulator
MHDIYLTTPQATLLVVEDDPDVFRTYANILLAEGITCDLATDGEIGWERIQTGRYRLIVTDHNMPNLMGWDLIERLNQSNYRVPIFLVAGALAEENPGAAGICLLEFIRKPIPGDSLLSKVRAALSLELPDWFTYPVELEGC